MNYSLKVDNINGFSHKIPQSLIQTEVIEQTGVILPLKNSLRFYNGLKSKQILQTEKDISAVAMTGPYIAVGVKGFLGELITTYFFNIYESNVLKKLCYQKTKISKLAISKNGKYLLSVGQSDGKTQDFVIINTQQDFTIATKIFYRKTVKNKQRIVDVVFSSTNPLFFALLYVDKLYFVKIIQETQSIEEILIKSNKVRQFTSMMFNESDTFCYTTSKNGDIAQIDIKKGRQVRVGPQKRIIISGIKFIKQIDEQNMLIVGQKGFIAVVEILQLKIIKQATLNEEIVSMTEFVDGVAFISTSKAIIYRLLSDTLQARTFYVCIKEKINEIAFSESCPQSVITCSVNQIIIWSVKELKPQLKIALPKIQCNSLCVDKFGKFIISAWTDGSIRLFHAYNGKLMKKLQNCHPGPISKVTVDYNQTKILSGGQKGEIKVWDLSEKKFGLALGSMSHHLKRINQLKINPQKFEELVVCCEDGTYSVWNLQTFDLIYCYKVCNFIKDCLFEDSLTISFIGSGSYLYKVIKANGKMIEKTLINNSHNNSLCLFENMIENKMVLYGGQKQYLYLMNNTIKGSLQFEANVYSQVTAVKLLPNKTTVVVGTHDGILLKLELSECFVQQKKTKDDQEQFHRFL